jgi:CHAT domain-containing protein
MTPQRYAEITRLCQSALGLSASARAAFLAAACAGDDELRANDIYNLELPAELVVLSACQPGMGKEVRAKASSASRAASCAPGRPAWSSACRR